MVFSKNGEGRIWRCLGTELNINKQFPPNINYLELCRTINNNPKIHKQRAKVGQFFFAGYEVYIKLLTFYQCVKLGLNPC